MFSLFHWVWLTISQHWFGYWFRAELRTSHYLNHWGTVLLTHICVTRPWWINRRFLISMTPTWSIQMEIYMQWRACYGHIYTYMTYRNVDRPKLKRRQIKTSTYQNINRPKRRQTETSTDQNIDRPKRRQTKPNQTKTSKYQNIELQKTLTYKTSTDRNVDCKI